MYVLVELAPRISDSYSVFFMLTYRCEQGWTIESGVDYGD